MAATYDDAALMVQLFRWSTELGMDEAFHEVFAPGFDPASATMDSKAVRTILTFGECIGTLVKNNILDRGLVNDAWAVSLAWQRVGAAALKQRAQLEEPRLYENFEALAG